MSLRQVDGIGPEFAKKLSLHGIATMEQLQRADVARLERILGRGPGFARSILEASQKFPNFTISVRRVTDYSTKTVDLFLDIKQTNTSYKPFKSRAKGLSRVALVIATNDDEHLFEFSEIAVGRLAEGYSHRVQVCVTKPTQKIDVSVIPEDIVGFDMHQEVALDVAPRTFTDTGKQSGGKAVAISDKLVKSPYFKTELPKPVEEIRIDQDDDEFGSVSDEALEALYEVERNMIDSLEVDRNKEVGNREPLAGEELNLRKKPLEATDGPHACNHKCRDKTICRHLCCKEGVFGKRKRKAEPNDCPKFNFGHAARDRAKKTSDFSHISDKENLSSEPEQRRKRFKLPPLKLLDVSDSESDFEACPLPGKPMVAPIPNIDPNPLKSMLTVQDVPRHGQKDEISSSHAGNFLKRSKRRRLISEDSDSEAEQLKQKVAKTENVAHHAPIPRWEDSPRLKGSATEIHHDMPVSGSGGTITDRNAHHKEYEVAFSEPDEWPFSAPPKRGDDVTVNDHSPLLPQLQPAPTQQVDPHVVDTRQITSTPVGGKEAPLKGDAESPPDMHENGEEMKKKVLLNFKNFLSRVSIS
ncbi:hypothetical protein M427DRAFT_155517 [Gonapodya prolifera JEL478]|uniref:SEC63 domain-containing protein n=1 Tax=Gonapodya prolifera (strain JEL478) TaxID=1344416 RepID=A0A139AF80_GONPJ|nr:hypothetical protein M427DRAFT_155517 [Gonapodya prolifera JEL478]|eukprot:KXS15073.1 hypothetical protein M427DRAFT_155517 [Gonapodya prolifera JEL478]